MLDKTADKDVAGESVSKLTVDAAHPARILMVLIPLSLWIWLCRDWPTRLGFYSDDWMVLLHPFAGTADAFRDILKLVVTRPVSAPYIWLAQAITDWSPARSQFLNAAMLLLSSASVGLLAAALVSASRVRQGVLAAACAAAASFIVFPSTVGTFAWGTGVSTAIPALPLFCLSVSFLVHSENSSWRLILGLTLAVLSHLSYEAFYFQEIAFLLFAATLRGTTIKEIRWRVLIGVFLINIACLAFNRLATGGIHKSFHWDFIHLFIGGYSHILAILGHAVREHKLLIAGTVVIAGSSGTVCLARLVGASRMSVAFLMMSGGIVASGLLYASAGYGLAAEGVMARVSIVIATYYAVSAGVLAAAAWSTLAKNRLPAVAFCLAAGLGLIALELTARARTAEWAQTWSYELARLSRLPAIVTSGDGLPDARQRIYVAIEDGPPLSLSPASAPWEITGAVAWASYRTTNNRSLTIDLWRGTSTVPRWFTAASGWFNRWDGQRFEQGFCAVGAVIYSASGPELWSWTSSTGALSKIEAPWAHECH